MKYIMIDDGLQDCPFLFPNHTHHSDVAESLRRLGEVVSAGFIGEDQDGNLECSGDSVSLGIKSREEDTAIVRKSVAQGSRYF